MGKSALITGITGQDGSYLAELLLAKGYTVHGVVRRSSTFSTERIDHIYRDPHEQTRLHLHYGDLTDGQALTNLMLAVEPDEIYNLGAQSHVRVSFDQPVCTPDGATRPFVRANMSRNGRRSFRCATSGSYSSNGSSIVSRRVR